MDFVSDVLFDGRRLRVLTLLDVFTREALAIELDKGIIGEQVVAILDAIIAIRAAAQGYHRALSQCAMAPSCLKRARPLGLRTQRHTRLQPTGQAVDNAFVGSFNGRLREECRNAHWLLSLNDARAKIEAWRQF